MDVSGIDPEAFRMQIERDTTTPYTRIKYYSRFKRFIVIIILLKKILNFLNYFLIINRLFYNKNN